MILGLSLSSASAILGAYVSLPPGMARAVRIARFQSIVLVVIGSLFYFSRFRAADLFAKWAVRLLLGAALALLDSPHLWTGFIHRAKHASPLAAEILCRQPSPLRHAALYALAQVERPHVERRIFGKPDNHRAVREFRDRLGLLEAKIGGSARYGSPGVRGAWHETR